MEVGFGEVFGSRTMMEMDVQITVNIRFWMFDFEIF
jgi:hypothetical protein